MPSQPPPTPLTIATNALSRLLKEEASYETELAKQKFQRVVAKATTKGGGGGKGKGKGGVDMEDGEEEGGNAEWRVRQEEQAIRETEAVFGPLRERIAGARERLEGLVVASSSSSGDGNDNGNAGGGGKEIEAAKEVLVKARERAST